MTIWDAFLVIYGVIIAFAGLAIWLALRFLKDRKLAWSMVGMKVVIIGEQMYYGAGRLFPDLYTQLSWYWPGVMSFKLLYCVTLAIIVSSLLRHRERI